MNARLKRAKVIINFLATKRVYTGQEVKQPKQQQQRQSRCKCMNEEYAMKTKRRASVKDSWLSGVGQCTSEMKFRCALNVHWAMWDIMNGIVVYYRIYRYLLAE